jgi:hypothetical protein
LALALELDESRHLHPIGELPGVVLYHQTRNGTPPSKTRPLTALVPDENSNKLAFDSIKAAIASPKNKDFPLIEVEFPPLEKLNKLGDGSLRSAMEVDDANLAFASKLISSLAPLPFMGPKTWLLASSAAPSSFMRNAKKSAGSAELFSLRDGLPEVAAGDVCILLSPSSRSDYDVAQKIASEGVAKAVVVVNGFAKDERSISARATMAYFLKPLTYNSQVVGYLTRAYPGRWATIDALTKEILSTKDDGEILVPKTNTPDLRASGKLVQQAVDARAIRARRG